VVPRDIHDGYHDRYSSLIRIGYRVVLVTNLPHHGKENICIASSVAVYTCGCQHRTPACIHRRYMISPYRHMQYNNHQPPFASACQFEVSKHHFCYFLSSLVERKHHCVVKNSVFITLLLLPSVIVRNFRHHISLIVSFL
jgi:hypothetical protein